MVKERRVMEQEAEALVKKRAAAGKTRNLRGSFMDGSQRPLDEDYQQPQAVGTPRNRDSENIFAQAPQENLRKTVGKPQTQNYMAPLNKGRNSEPKKEYNNFVGDDIRDQIKSL